MLKARKKKLKANLINKNDIASYLFKKMSKLRALLNSQPPTKKSCDYNAHAWLIGPSI